MMGTVFHVDFRTASAESDCNRTSYTVYIPDRSVMVRNDVRRDLIRRRVLRFQRGR
jgi:hypothetical protein